MIINIMQIPISGREALQMSRAVRAVSFNGPPAYMTQRQKETRRTAKSKTVSTHNAIFSGLLSFLIITFSFR